MTRKEAIENILAYFEENEAVFNDCIEELDSYNGYVGDDRYYYMEDLDEIYHDVEATELLRRAFYGYDEDSYTIDYRGERVHDAFNPNRTYFTFNGYGNLVSADYKDYSGFMDHYAIEEMADHRNYIYTIGDTPELSELFDEYDSAEEVA